MRNYSKKLCLFLCGFLLVTICFSCRKKFNYTFSDGFPGPGADSTTITVSDTSMFKVDRSKYREARGFPGLVGEHVPRVKDSEVTLDMEYNSAAKTMRTSVPPQPMFSTGMYAPPGELIEITVPAGMRSLTVQIGAWTDDKNDMLNAPRDPIIYTKQKLHPGKNYVRNLYGGPIYIWTDHSIPQPVTLLFTGSVVSPDYVLGETDPEKWWKEVQATEVPWIEFRSPRMIVLVARWRVVKNKVDYPEKLMKWWNDFIMDTCFYQLMGLSKHPDNPVDLAPDLPYRAVLDIAGGGGGHSGYPAVGTANEAWFAEFADTNRVHNMLTRRSHYGQGYWHEFGHDSQQGAWTLSNWGEETNELIVFYIVHRMGLNHFPNDTTYLFNYVYPNTEVTWTRSLEYVEKRGEKRFIQDFQPHGAFIPLLQLMHAFGSGWITKLYKKTRRLKRSPKTDLDKKDYIYKTVSDFIGKDCRLFFHAWGMRLSDQAKETIAEKDYPLLKRNIWTWNPVTDTGGNRIVDPNDTKFWNVVDNSSFQTTYEDGSASNILDGNPSTCWITEWYPDQKIPPHSVTVDMGLPLEVSTFDFVQRDFSTQEIKFVEIKVSDDNEHWSSLGTHKLNKGTSVQKISIPSKTFQYFKLIVKNVQSIYGGSEDKTVALADVWVEK